MIKIVVNNKELESAPKDLVSVGSMIQSIPHGTVIDPADFTPPMTGVEVAPSAQGPNMIYQQSYIHTVGGTMGRKRAQLAMKDRFVAVVGDAYSKIDVDEVDLMKLQTIGEGGYEVLCELERALDFGNHIESMNLAWGNRLCSVLGFDYADLARNRQSYIDLHNRLAELLNNKFYICKTETIMKIAALSGKIYTCDADAKTQLLVFTPIECDAFDFTTGDITCGNYFMTSAGGYNRYEQKKLFSLISLTTYIDLLEAFSMSAWFNEVIPYLNHIYQDSGLLFKVEPYKARDIKDVVVECNIAMKEVFRNADRVNLFPSDTPSDALKIFQDSDGYIQQGVHTSESPAGYGLRVQSLYYKSSTDPFLPCLNVVCGSGVNNFKFTSEKLLNIEDYPAGDDRLATVLDYCVIIGPATDGNTQSFNTVSVDYCGSIVFTWIRAYYLGSSGVLNDAFVSQYLIDTFNSGWVNAPHISAISTPASTMFNEIKKFDADIRPMQWCLAITITSSGFRLGVSTPIVHDYDNYFPIVYKELYAYHQARIYDTFYIPAPKFTSRK